MSPFDERSMFSVAVISPNVTLSSAPFRCTEPFVAFALIAVGELTFNLFDSSPIFAPSSVIAPVEETAFCKPERCFMSFTASRLTPPVPPEMSSFICIFDAVALTEFVPVIAALFVSVPVAFRSTSPPVRAAPSVISDASALTLPVPVIACEFVIVLSAIRLIFPPDSMPSMAIVSASILTLFVPSIDAVFLKFPSASKVRLPPETVSPVVILSASILTVFVPVIDAVFSNVVPEVISTSDASIEPPTETEFASISTVPDAVTEPVFVNEFVAERVAF